MNIEIKSKNKFIVTENKKQIGYIKFHHPDDIATDRNLEIDYVYVTKEFRRKGIATELLKLVLELNKNVVWVSLWTGKECEIDGSWVLYSKMGFEEKTYLPDYYDDGVGTRLMCLYNTIL